MVCTKCQIEFANNGSFKRHIMTCDLNEQKIDLMIQDYTNNELTIREMGQKYKIYYLHLKKIFNDRNIQLRKAGDPTRKNRLKRPHTTETKQKISERRKKFLKLNPDKHPWKLNSKFKSAPCDLLKSILIEMCVNFTPEFRVGDKMYSLDIAMPDRNMAIEVNGNQHYNSDGSLKDYYQKRHEYFKSLGWKIIEMHYSIPYSNNIRTIISNIIEESESIYEFDYDSYLKSRLNKGNKKCKCGSSIKSVSKLCKRCRGLSIRKDRPNSQTLKSDINSLGYAGTGRKYNVSPTSIRRWEKL